MSIALVFVPALVLAIAHGNTGGNVVWKLLADVLPKVTHLGVFSRKGLFVSCLIIVYVEIGHSNALVMVGNPVSLHLGVVLGVSFAVLKWVAL